MLRIALGALPVGLAFGVILPSEARADCATVNPAQTTTYDLSCSPITFGSATNIVVAGSAGVQGDSSTAWTLTNNGGIQGGPYGIVFASSGSALTNAGTIAATGTTSEGIWLQDGGTISNIGGTISGGTAGIASFLTMATVTNSGFISGGNVGVNLYGGGTLTNESAGTISGGEVAGVYVVGGTVDNSGIIKGGGPTVHLGDGTDQGTGLYMADGGTVTNESGATISGQSMGIFARTAAITVTNLGAISGEVHGISVGDSVAGTLTNSGTITGTGTASTAVQLSNGGSVNNQIGGTISGVAGGLYSSGSAASVTNAGTISATGSSGWAVYLQSGGTFSNLTGGTISANGNGVMVQGGTGSVTNTGSIAGGTGSTAAGVLLTNVSNGAVTNQSGGTISGGAYGVSVGGNTATVTNAGEISATGVSSLGVSLQDGGVVVNQAGGMISGTNTGVAVQGGTGSVTNTGDIVGGTGSSAAGVLLTNVSDGAVTNQSGGTISGGAFGVSTSGNTATVTNAGEIGATGVSSLGVSLQNGGSVINQAGGTITGVSVGVGVGSGVATVTNAGTIGGASASVNFSGVGANVLTLQTGSTLNGDAVGSTAVGATNALVLTGHGTANNDFVNFSTLNAEGSGTWTLGGSAKFSGDTQVTSGTLLVNGAFNAPTLEIAANAEFDDAGTVTVSGAVTNSGNLTIDGVPMLVANIGGTYTQLAGGSLNLLNGGTLDPAQITVKGGQWGGGGTVVGNVVMTGGKLQVGGGAGGSLTVEGDYSQTGGEIVFQVNPDGHGGYLETTLKFDTGAAIGISDTEIVFDFLNGASASQFSADNLLNLDTFFSLTGGGQFCAVLDCATAFKDISFADNVSGLTIAGFDPISGALTIGGFASASLSSRAAVPEPATLTLIATGLAFAGGFGSRRRKARANG